MPDEYDFFVSYARADNQQGFVRGFVDGIVAEHRRFTGGRELRYFFDTERIPNFASWELEIFQKHLIRARLFLAFLSPAYFASDICRREWRAWLDREIALHVFGDGAAPIYFIEVPGLCSNPALSEFDVARMVAKLCQREPCEHFVKETGQFVSEIRRRQIVARLVDQAVQPFHNTGRTELQMATLREVLAKLAEDLDRRSRDVEMAAASDNEVPPYNRRFTGRHEELLELRKLLTDNGTGVVAGIHGLGGIGKTELALTYAHAFAGVYPGGRYLVPCEHQTNLREAVLHLGSYSAFAPHISDEQRKLPDEYFAAIVRLLKARIQNRGRVLLIFDNITDAQLASRQQTDSFTLLGAELHLLMTTRLIPKLEAGWVTLGELKPADALALLERYRAFADDSERAAGERIANRLGGFALAIELVAAHLEAHPTATYAGLAATMGLDDLDVLATDDDFELRRHNHERRLQAVLGPTLNGLTDPQRWALELASFLPPDGTPLPWLKDLVTDECPSIAIADKFLGDGWESLCDRLVRLGLFTRVEDESTNRRQVKIHRLVQQLVRREMPPDYVKLCRARINGRILDRIEELGASTQWREIRWEIESLEALAWQWDEDNDPAAKWFIGQVAIFWHRLAEWSRAITLMRHALAGYERSFGLDHPDVATALNNLALMLCETNQLAEAEPLMRRALAIDVNHHGPNSPTTAKRYASLARLLMDTNRLAKADALVTQALAIDEANFGPDDPSVAADLGLPARLLTERNQLDEAEPLLRRSLAIEEVHFGPEHPTVAASLNNLALLLQNTNRSAEAEPIFARVMAIFEDAYGAFHPKIATVLNNSAGNLSNTNRHSEAEPLLWRALAIDEQCYGPDHPQVAIRLNNLARLLQDTNRPIEAEPLLARSLAIYCRSTRDSGHLYPELIPVLINYRFLLIMLDVPIPEQRKKLIALGVDPSWQDGMALPSITERD